MISRLIALKGRHNGQRAVLVANGPSLNLMDLSFLRRETAIGLNKIYLGIKKFGFYPRYLVAVNDRVVAQAADDLKAMNCVKFISQRNARIVPENALTYHINTLNPPARFCRDIAQGVHEGWTVSYVAMQIAFYLGFQEVIIIGMDHRYEYTGRPNDPSHLIGADPNHFSPDYFGGGQTWDNPDLRHSEESYRIARAEFEKAGRQIIDATVDGACDVFEKADYRRLFGVAQ
ncbi:6-hydroxymethylpterin diphosphokinase MptE-like protein [Accumulibacter sp.]|uniref:6-hydroxymethylpterin diphosphokinase MptE-like protein n=1 Tax=Accumulibacter sp. TaxID=2053492 RepID=UPI00260BE88E|nr:6-hydroxymethylpterin diphosphokinase MptE-like protein [Accumulibacter sp.]